MCGKYGLYAIFDGTYFFTVVAYRRRKILCDAGNVELLRTAFRTVKSAHPFAIDAFVLLPEHLHCIWTLQPGDWDYPMRWNAIKKYFSEHCPAAYKLPPTAAQRRKRMQTLWQPRYWEHQIRDDRDFEKHCDYIHWNPVKHGLVSRVGDWPYPSFHRFVRLGLYPPDWVGNAEIPDNIEFGGMIRMIGEHCRSSRIHAVRALHPAPNVAVHVGLFPAVKYWNVGQDRRRD